MNINNNINNVDIRLTSLESIEIPDSSNDINGIYGKITTIQYNISNINSNIPTI
jgi:hypothetical protein